jgi:serine protease Do
MIQFFKGVFCAMLGVLAAAAHGSITPDAAQSLFERVVPSLVAVQFTVETELGKGEFIMPGVVVSEDGLMLLPGGELLPRIPESQIKEVKVIVPLQDKEHEELEADLVGRDPRNDTNLVKPRQSRPWKPIRFEDVPPRIGESLISVGLMPKEAGYRPFLAQGMVGGFARGDMPFVIATGGGLAAVGAPVFNSSGQAIGWVNYYSGQQYLLHATLSRRGSDPADEMRALMLPPRLFVPTRGFVQSLLEPPVVGQRLKLPWMGLPNLNGLNKDVAQEYGLENQPALEVGDVVPDSPAEAAGIKVGMKIVKLNGQPLERGDSASELPGIFWRKIIRMHVGEKVTLSVLTARDKPMQDIQITLGEQPKDAIYARRFWAEDLGFGVRELVFEDTYERKQPADLKGVLVSIVKADSAAASGKLVREDIITQLNSQTVSDIEQFERDYKSLRAANPREAIVLVIMKSNGSTQTIRIEPPQ